MKILAPLAGIDTLDSDLIHSLELDSRFGRKTTFALRRFLACCSHPVRIEAGGNVERHVLQPIHEQGITSSSMPASLRLLGQGEKASARFTSKPDSTHWPSQPTFTIGSESPVGARLSVLEPANAAGKIALHLQAETIHI